MKRRRYDESLKREAIRIAQQGNHPVKDIAAELGVSRGSIYRWMKDHPYESGDSASSPGITSASDQDYRRLKRQYCELEEELEILKRAVAIFSRTTR